MSQLHCQELALAPDGKDSFSGRGRNDTGAFTIRVTRRSGKIDFEGTYDQPGQGKFGGSASWTRTVNSGLGWHKSRLATEDSFRSQR